MKVLLTKDIKTEENHGFEEFEDISLDGELSPLSEEAVKNL